MSTTIYLIRHGESQANERDVFLGHYNLDLTAIGQKQASITAEHLKKQVPSVDAIYASDLTRAYQTAQCTAKRFNMPIIKDEKLREIDAGFWDNLSFTELNERFAESYNVWVSDIGNARCDGGESVRELQQRVVSAIARIAENHNEQTVLLFTHATPIRVFAAHCLEKSLDEIKTVPWVTNASVTKAVYDHGTFQLVEYGRDDFIGDFVTKLPSNV